MAEEEGFGVAEPVFTGEPLGLALGLGATLAVAEGDGLATTGLGGSGFGVSQAPNTVALAAKTVDKTKDLLIVFLLNDPKRERIAVRCTDIHSRTDAGVFLRITVG